MTMGAIASLKEVWNDWQLRALVLLSLALQTVLIIMGNRRKYTKNSILLTIVVWVPYIIADTIATTALGVLTRNKFVDHGGLDANMELHAFWAPFLLLHLGGPDTITAYSLEDNELWTRQLLQLVVQTGFAFYIVGTVWTGSLLSILSIPMLFAGLLKYGERTWVLWSACYEQRRVSESIESLRESSMKHDSFSVDDENDDSLLALAHRFGKLTKRFFVDLVLHPPSDSRRTLLETMCKIWMQMSHINAFKTIEMQLGFMYDALYTKAMVTYTPWGLVLRFVSFLFSCIVLILFSVLYSRHKYSKADLYVTFLLLTVAVFLELYAALVALSSNQSIAWLTINKRRNISRAVTSSLQLLRNPTWSSMMGQFSMLSYILQEKPTGCRRLLLSYLPKCLHKIPNISKLKRSLEIQEYEDYQEVTEHLKAFIFRCFLEEYNRGEPREPIRNSKGKISLQRNGYNFKSGNLGLLIGMDVELSVIVWHIVTEFSFHLDAENIASYQEEINNRGGNAETGQSIYDNIGLCYELSMYISRYMMYLIALSPSLLPKGGILSADLFENTCVFGRKWVKSWTAGKATNNAQDTDRKMIIQSILNNLRELLENSPSELLELSILFYVCELFDDIWDSNEQKEVERKWRTICGVWMELLAHISIECKGNQHAQGLRQGGELLTHVALLMAHFGVITKLDVNSTIYDWYADLLWP